MDLKGKRILVIGGADGKCGRKGLKNRAIGKVSEKIANTFIDFAMV